MVNVIRIGKSLVVSITCGIALAAGNANAQDSSAGPYRLEGIVMNGGGPVSADGYRSQGSAGQSTAGLMSTSPYAIAGGLWRPLAPDVTVAGRVFDANGRALKNATVTLTDELGTVRTVVAALGKFRFDNVPTARAYMVMVVSQRFTFIPRSIFVEDQISNLFLNSL